MMEGINKWMNEKMNELNIRHRKEKLANAHPEMPHKTSKPNEHALNNNTLKGDKFLIDL